jgi:hypothetical protein
MGGDLLHLSRFAIARRTHIDVISGEIARFVPTRSPKGNLNLFYGMLCCKRAGYFKEMLVPAVGGYGIHYHERKPFF